jgi:DNA repair protein RecN (Recombination protein N)
VSNSAERIETLQAEEQRLLNEAGQVAAELSEGRTVAGDRLAREIERELADLRMEKAQFQVNITHVEAEDGLPANGKRYEFDATGFDKAEFLISANIGEPLRPLIKTASGGETARLMLALKVVLSSVDPVPTLIFDEIDSGIGGRIGTVIGRKLWDLTSEHQVLCVTHLPQIASFADDHYRVYKQVVEGRTQTLVSLLEDSGRIGELAQMLGSTTDATRRSAVEMNEQTIAQKKQARKTAKRIDPD